jgi:DNA (cytosine-5)-methyltransferase 1
MYVIECLRNEGYVVSSEPTIFSPHRIAPEFGGRPQIRERLFIAATYSPRNSHREPEKLALLPGRQMADVQAWDLSEFLDEDQTDAIGLSKDEISWLEAWDSFQREMRKKTSSRLPGFPLWADEWRPMSNQSRQRQLRQVPDWKKVFLKNNWSFFDAHESFIKRWKEKECIDDFPPSRRKFEWQAQDESSVWDCTIHLRPSGIRVKKLNYLPAFVAMNQTSILGPYLRRISPREAARLQGLPESFTFRDQPLSQTYKQLGNGVNVGVVWQVMQSLISRDQSLLEKRDPQLVQLVLSSSASPDRVIKK